MLLQYCWAIACWAFDVDYANCRINIIVSHRMHVLRGSIASNDSSIVACPHNDDEFFFKESHFTSRHE